MNFPSQCAGALLAVLLFGPPTASAVANSFLSNSLVYDNQARFLQAPNFSANYVAQFIDIRDSSCAAPNPVISILCIGDIVVTSVSDSSIECNESSGFPGWNTLECVNTCSGAACEQVFAGQDRASAPFGAIEYKCSGDDLGDVNTAFQIDSPGDASCGVGVDVFGRGGRLGVSCGDDDEYNFDDFFFECSLGSSSTPLFPAPTNEYSCLELSFCELGACELDPFIINADLPSFQDTCVDSGVGPIPAVAPTVAVTPPSSIATSARFQAAFSTLSTNPGSCTAENTDSVRITCSNGGALELEDLSFGVDCILPTSDVAVCSFAPTSTVTQLADVTYTCTSSATPTTQVEFNANDYECSDTASVLHALQVGVFCDFAEEPLFLDYFFECGEEMNQFANWDEFGEAGPRFTCTQSTEISGGSGMQTVDPVLVATDDAWVEDVTKECLYPGSAVALPTSSTTNDSPSVSPVLPIENLDPTNAPSDGASIPVSDTPREIESPSPTASPIDTNTVPGGPTAGDLGDFLFRANYVGQFQYVKDTFCGGPDPVVQAHCLGTIEVKSTSDPGITCTPTDSLDGFNSVECTTSCASDAECANVFLNSNMVVQDGPLASVYFSCSGNTYQEINGLFTYENSGDGACTANALTGRNLHATRMGISCPVEGSEETEYTFDELYFECFSSNVAAPFDSSPGNELLCFDGDICSDGACAVSFSQVGVLADIAYTRDCVESTEPILEAPTAAAPVDVGLQITVQFQAAWGLLFDELSASFCSGNTPTIRATCTNDSTILFLDSTSDTTVCTAVESNVLECIDSGDSFVNQYSAVTYSCSGSGLPESTVEYPPADAFCEGNALDATVSHGLQLGIYCDAIEDFFFGNLYVECSNRSNQFGNFDEIGEPGIRYTCLEEVTFSASSTADEAQSISMVSVETDPSWTSNADDGCFQLSTSGGSPTATLTPPPVASPTLPPLAILITGPPTASPVASTTESPTLTPVAAISDTVTTQSPTLSPVAAITASPGSNNSVGGLGFQSQSSRPSLQHTLWLFAVSAAVFLHAVF